MGISQASKNVFGRVGFTKSSPQTQSSLASIESLTMPLVQEVVISADVRCKECQKRINHVLSRMNADTESVVVNLLEKKVTVICTYPSTKITAPGKQIITKYKHPLAKISLFRMIFFTPSSR